VTDRVERFRALYDPGYPRMMAYALRRARTRDEAYDIVGDIFLVAWRRLDEAPAEERWMAWLYGIGRRVLANHYRATDRRGRLAERLQAPPQDEGFELVHQALDRLRPADREILTLVAWDDLGNDEIAVALELSPGTVAVRLHRARMRLARELGRLGYREVKSGGASRTPDRAKGTDPSEETET